VKPLKGKQAMHVAMKKSSHVGHSIGKDIAKGTMVGAIVKTGGTLIVTQPNIQLWFLD
jgi:hypothetical protein